MSESRLQFPLPGDLSFADKRNRNPNWTESENIHFLEILTTDTILELFAANKSKHAFCVVAQELHSKGSEKTWDQCRLKLKNLKSKYRYVKERIPNIDEVDVEDKDILKQLIADCQGRGISASNIKHMKYLKRFFNKLAQAIADNDASDPKPGPSTRLDFESSLEDGEYFSLASPEVQIEEPVAKKRRKTVEESNGFVKGNLQDGYKFIEALNREMMEQFMENQKRYTSSYLKWEQERLQREQLAMEQWRSEAREHEKQMFGTFCNTMAKCNRALNSLLLAKQEAQDEVKKLRGILEKNGIVGIPTDMKKKQPVEDEIILSLDDTDE